MSESIHLEGLRFQVTRSPRRRTVGITVGREGDLSVLAPVAAPRAQVESVVRRKLMWVFGKLATKALLFSPETTREYVSGEGFRYLGRSYRLLLSAGGSAERGRLQLAGGRFIMHRGDRDRGEVLFRLWYRERAATWLDRRVTEYAPRIGTAPKKVTVRDLGNRWGSCTTVGTVNFHWRLIRLPPTLIDYVIVHELAHLLEPRHDAAFWEKVEQVLPDYLTRRRKLAQVGSDY